MISNIDIEDMTDAQDEANTVPLPCPFCGGEAVVLEGEECAWVQCLDMKMHRAMFVDGDNNAAAEALEQWNRRADLARPSQAGDERAARLRDVACGATTMIGHALDDGQIDEEVAGNFEALFTDLNDAIAAMDTPKGGEDE